MLSNYHKTNITLSNISQLELFIEQIFSLHGSDEGFCYLHSGSTNTSYIFCAPVLQIKVHQTYSWKWSTGHCEFETPWDALHLLNDIDTFQNTEITVPCSAGWFSYEFLQFIEDIRTKDLQHLPLANFYIYSKIIAVESGEEPKVCIHTLSFTDFPKPFWSFNIPNTCKPNHSIRDSNHKHTNGHNADLDRYTSCTKPKYLKKINHLKEQIVDGNVYQVNLSQEFALPLADVSAAELFLSTLETSPAEYSAYIHVSEPKSLTIICASPELFFKKQANNVTCSPIKGTRPRGRNPAEDHSLASELVGSAKDKAELAMIVDLVRNDLGRVAEIGSVQVIEHARIQSLPQVHHLVSEIECKLKAKTSFCDLIKAVFPCGSITGAPKIASMKFIEKLEEHPRGIYTGSIGYVGFNGNACFNVAIRSGIVTNDTFCIYAGGGIVTDSDPQAEYQETIDKAQALYLSWLACTQNP